MSEISGTRFECYLTKVEDDENGDGIGSPNGKWLIELVLVGHGMSNTTFQMVRMC